MGITRVFPKKNTFLINFYRFFNLKGFILEVLFFFLRHCEVILNFFGEKQCRGIL